jgi:DNA-3-methyladenine glycosylase II
VTDLARHVEAGTVQLHTLGRRDDDQVVAELTQVWGIGAWTAHMFLIFSLHRMDVWPTGDFGVRAGWERLTATSATQDAAEHLRPYRSLAAWYCWRLVDGTEP